MKIVPETLVVRNQDVETKAKGNAKGVEEAVVVEEGAAAVIYIWVVIRPKNGQHCPKRRNSVFKNSAAKHVTMTTNQCNDNLKSIASE